MATGTGFFLLIFFFFATLLRPGTEIAEAPGQGPSASFWTKLALDSLRSEDPQPGMQPQSASVVTDRHTGDGSGQGPSASFWTTLAIGATRVEFSQPGM